MFLALLAGSIFFGPIGFVLAVPILAVTNVFWRYFRGLDSRSPPVEVKPKQIL